MSDKLELSENHRRVVSVLMRGIDRMCSDIESSLEEPDGILQQMTDDLSRTQKRELRQLTFRVREEVRRVAAEIALEKSVLSMRRKICALVSANIVNLEESDPQKLRGYGALSDAVINKLQGEFTLLLRLLERMSTLLESPEAWF